MALWRDILEFGRRVRRHWEPLATGGLALVVLHVISYVTHGEIPPWSIWTLIGLSIFASSFLAWQETWHTSQAQTALLDQRQRKIRIRKALGQFQEEATEMKLALEMFTISPEADAQAEYLAWEAKIADYLAANIDMSYKSRFLDETGLPEMQTPTLNHIHRFVWRRISLRLLRLQEFIKEHL